MVCHFGKLTENELPRSEPGLYQVTGHHLKSIDHHHVTACTFEDQDDSVLRVLLTLLTEETNK